MRSNKNHATRFLLRRNLFIGVIVFLTTFFMLPFWALSHIPQEKESVAAADLLSQDLAAERLTRAVSSDVLTSPLNLEAMVILYGGLGFLTAMMLMRHQFSRRQSLLHAALPDRRERDYLRRCAAYVVLCLAPIILNLLLYLLVVAANGLIGYVAWGTLLPKFFMLLMINAYGFAVGMLASVLTGTYWAALIAGAALTIGVECTSYLWYDLAGRYLHTLVRDSYTDALLRLSPAYSLYKGFYKPGEFAFWPGVAATLLALALSFQLYRIRRTERAEHTLAFTPLHSIMGFLLPLTGGTLLGMVVMMSFGTEISLIAGMVLGAFLTYWVCRMVFTQRFCGIARQIHLPAASAAVLILGVVILHGDLLGYDRFQPARDELTAITYRPGNTHTSEVVTLTSEDTLDAAYEWCTLMNEEINSYENGLIKGSSPFSGSDVVITYRMGNREVHRHYPNRRMRTQAQSSLKTIIESGDYRQSLIQHNHLYSWNISRLYFNPASRVLQTNEFYEQFSISRFYTGYSSEKDGEEIDTLLLAFKEDILSRTLEEKQQEPILHLSFSIEVPDSRDTLYREMDVYPGDTNFLQLLFGDKTDDVVQYAAGGFAHDEDTVVLKVRYAQTRREMRESGKSTQDIVESVTAATSPEQAAQWIAQAQDTSALNYYFKPYVEELPYQRLYIYDLDEVKEYSAAYGYEVPQDPADFYSNNAIPAMLILDYVGSDA